MELYTQLPSRRVSLLEPSPQSQWRAGLPCRAYAVAIPDSRGVSAILPWPGMEVGAGLGCETTTTRGNARQIAPPRRLRPGNTPRPMIRAVERRDAWARDAAAFNPPDTTSKAQ